MKKKTKTIEIEGIKVELEERVCKCGCGMTFWVTPKSKQEYARKSCQFPASAEEPSYVIPGDALGY